MAQLTFGAVGSTVPPVTPSDVGNPSGNLSSLDALLATPSVLLAAKPNDGFVSIRRQAPVEGIFGVNNRATIEIQVRPLTGADLGTLNTSRANVDKQLDAVAGKINQENLKAYGTGTAGLRDKAEDAGYYRSPAHLAWADAAEARTGGRIPAEWWVRNDPFGGTAGNGPNVLPSGTYPGVTSRIAMAHDTDWTLGRHFNAGPMDALYTSKASPADLGSYGLVPNHSIDRSFGNPYSSGAGQADWKVDYWRTGS